MNLGEQVTVEIAANRRWVDTGVELQVGDSYVMSAAGQWWDAGIQTNPAGYESPNGVLRFAERWRRLRDARWFALVGSISRRSDVLFLIGSGCVYSPTRAGQLTCFANDVWVAYLNNSGAIELSIRRDS